MIPPLDADALQTLTVSQLLMRLKTLEGRRLLLARAVEQHGPIDLDRAPLAVRAIIVEMNTIKTALAATQDEARDRLDARQPVITGDER